jgi:hypothetical protein
MRRLDCGNLFENSQPLVTSKKNFFPINSTYPVAEIPLVFEKTVSDFAQFPRGNDNTLGPKKNRQEFPKFVHSATGMISQNQSRQESLRGTVIIGRKIPRFSTPDTDPRLMAAAGSYISARRSSIPQITLLSSRWNPRGSEQTIDSPVPQGESG